MRWALFLLAGFAVADTPLDLFRGAAEALSEKNAQVFLEAFDKDMPGYAVLRGKVEGLLSGTAEVGSAIEIVSDEGDDRRRVVELDWLLEVSDQRARRGIVKCRVERRGKKWKITSLEPVEFFEY